MAAVEQAKVEAMPFEDPISPEVMKYTPDTPNVQEMEAFSRFLYASKCVALVGGLIKWFNENRTGLTGIIMEKKEGNVYLIRGLIDSYRGDFKPSSFRITFKGARGAGYITLGCDFPFALNPEKGYVERAGTSSRFYLDLGRKELMRYDFVDGGEKMVRLARIMSDGTPKEL